jgi:hypothetical protein
MSDISRRSFAESLAAAVLAPRLGARAESIRLAGWAAGGREGSEDPSALAQALTEVIRVQYGARLSAEDLATISHQIQTGLERVDQLRKVTLANGDEPEFLPGATRRASLPP